MGPARSHVAWPGWLAATGLLTVLGTTPAGAADEWQKVGADSRSGVSGIAYEGPTADGAGSHALIVHDNKRAGQPRLSRVTLAPSPSVLGTFPGYKIEALECLPASPEAAVGTPEAPAQRPLKEGWLSAPPRRYGPDQPCQPEIRSIIWYG